MAGTGKAAREINGFRIQVMPAATRNPEVFECGARVLSAKGKELFIALDRGMRILDISGKDIGGDGSPAAVFEGYSGGAHCCWAYWIVSLGLKPKLLRKLDNSRGIAFEDLNKDGKIKLVTQDGAFDYFDDLPHVASPFPTVILRLKGTRIERVDSEFWPLYEKTIADARALLTPHCTDLFRTHGSKSQGDSEGCDPTNTKLQILTIVLNTLYGGREKESWQELATYWPTEDQDRIRKVILKTAKGSLLGDTSLPDYGNAPSLR
jgi:hypothetical protein